MEAGGTVTTDDTGDGTGEADPVETTLTSPVAGAVTITENDSGGTGPADGFDALVVERVRGRTSVRITSRVGGRLPLHSTGVGKAILAFSSP